MKAQYGEPWSAIFADYWIGSTSPAGTYTIQIVAGDKEIRAEPEHRKRIVACVNTLSGISDEALGIVQRHLEAVRVFYADAPYGPSAEDSRQIVVHTQKELGRLLAKVRT